MVDTKLVGTPTATLRALKDLYSWAEELHLVYAWASSADGTDEHWTALPQSHVRRAIIGVHFARTEPLVLRALHARGVLRVAVNLEGVFHPKMVLGTKGKRARVLLGSSNFTSGGFAKNTEVNVLVAGLLSEPFFRQLSEFIDGLWQDANLREPDEAWLRSYARLFDARAVPPASPTRPVLAAPPPAEEPPLQTLEATLRRQHTRLSPPDRAWGILQLVKAHADAGDLPSHAAMAKSIRMRSQAYFSKLLRIMKTVHPEIIEQWRRDWQTTRPSLRITVEAMLALGEWPRARQQEEYEKLSRGR